jgi:hypothetical protein
MAKPSKPPVIRQMGDHHSVPRTDCSLLASTRLSLLLSLFALVGCSNENTQRRNSTSAYWAELSRICHQISVANENMGNFSTAVAAAAALETAAEMCSEIADEISRLPTTFVDLDAVEFAADYVQLLNECSLICNDLQSLFERDRLLQEHSSSLSAVIESVVRGALGDPLGKSEELAAASQQLNMQGVDVHSRWAKVQQRIAVIDAREVMLRAILADKYHREFAALTPPKKRKI